jgi:hypothetical protein
MIMLPDKIVQLFEWTRVWREIWMDGRKPLDDVGPFWGTAPQSVNGMGIRWSLRPTISTHEPGWINGAARSASRSSCRSGGRASKDNLDLVMTIDDPVMYTKPWATAKRSFRFQTKDMPDGEMIEVIFAPVDEKEFNQRVRNPAAGVK